MEIITMFICTECKKEFTQSCHLIRHLRNIHGVDIVSEKKAKSENAKQSALPFNFSRDVERNVFECLDCKRLFLSPEAGYISEKYIKFLITLTKTI